MKSICFIISKKENEFRRAIVLKDLINVKNKEMVKEIKNDFTL